MATHDEVSFEFQLAAEPGKLSDGDLHVRRDAGDARVIGRAGNHGRRATPAPRPAGPESLAPVLAPILKDLGCEERSREGALATAWGRGGGADLAAKARPVSFRSDC